VATDYSLLLAAFQPELAGLDKDPPTGWRVVLTGIGGVTAAAATARILVELRPTRALFIGTCGTYGNSLPAVKQVSQAKLAIGLVIRLKGGTKVNISVFLL